MLHLVPILKDGFGSKMTSVLRQNIKIAISVFQDDDTS